MCVPPFSEMPVPVFDHVFCKDHMGVTAGIEGDYQHGVSAGRGLPY